MAQQNQNTKPTVFQRLGMLFGGNGAYLHDTEEERINRYNINGDTVLLRTKDIDVYNQEKLALKQQRLLAKQWIRAQYDIENKSLAGLTDVKIMYRDADLMDLFPEIGAALDVLMEEACYSGLNNRLVEITSKSERVKSILQDLLYNRLSIHMTLPMICRSMCKYGNTFMLLNLDRENGIMGWKQLPVYEMERYESGMDNPYAYAFAPRKNVEGNAHDDTKFVWVGQNEFIPYQNWQIAHFRLLYDSLLLPYGMSILNKARRHFRMLSMMEDMMLIYRLDKSMERRVFKIDVGTIDEADVPAYVQQIANNFKRTPLTDPMTGQLDLRKNILAPTDDWFIPTRDPTAPSPIETLPAGQNMTAMDDIKYMQNKVFTGIGVPKPFISFEEVGGDGKNLSMLDVRFMRRVNRIQQYLILELNKICIIHLYLLGFHDELTNFTLSMHTPSSVAEQLELDNLQKKIAIAKDAILEPGNGIPVMSVTRAWKEIFGWSQKEISDNLNEMRLEKALANELGLTPQIIQRTGLFDAVDNIYGEPGAQYNMSQQPDDEGGFGGGGGGGFSGGSLGGDIGAIGGFGGGEEEMTGAEGEMDMGEAAAENEGLAGVGGEETAPEGPTPTEQLAEMLARKQKENIINEYKNIGETLSERCKKYQKKRETKKKK